MTHFEVFLAIWRVEQSVGYKGTGFTGALLRFLGGNKFTRGQDNTVHLLTICKEEHVLSGLTGLGLHASSS